MELAGYLAVVRRWWWTLLVATWVAGLSGYIIASQLPPTYESRAQLLVGPINTDVDTLRASSQLVLTYAPLVTSDALLSETIKELGLQTTTQELALAVRATANDTTRLLTIRAQAGTPKLAADIAAHLAQELIALTGGSGIALPEGELQIIGFPQEIPDPIAPQVTLIALLAGVAGLIAALALVLLIEYFSTTVRSAEDVTRLAGTPVLGSVPPARIVPGPGGDFRIVGRSEQKAKLDLLAARLIVTPDGQPLRRLLVVDSGTGDTAAVIAAGLASAMAESGRRVALIDGDILGGRLSDMLRVADRPGVADLLAEPAAEPRALLLRPQGRIGILPVGREEAGGLPDAARAEQILERLLEDSDIVIIAGAPLQVAAASLTWARVSDSTLLVVERDRAKREALAGDVEILRLAGAHLVGTVLAEGSGRPSGSRRARPTTPGPYPRPRPAGALAGEGPGRGGSVSGYASIAADDERAARARAADGSRRRTRPRDGSDEGETVDDSRRG